MLALGLALPAAAAEPCEDVAARVDAAWTAFDDAELGMAADVLDSAIQELSCQSRLLSADELFELFELDALVSLGNEDEDRAVYAIIRAVTVDPTRGTSPENGPALAALHETWQKRLSGVRVRVQVAGQQALYLDGRPIAPGATVEVVAGEHLLQLEEADGVYSEVLELESDAGIVTSPRQPGAAFATTSLAPLVPDPVPTPPRRRKGGAPGTPAVWGTGLGLAAAGGGAVLAGFLLESRFAGRTYDDDSYDGCARADACYASARESAIRRDATTIRALYGAGYGLLGVGGTMTVAGFAVSPKRDGVALSVTVPIP
jgi:hypothetical protein